MSSGTKRAAPDDFDSSTAVARPAPPHRTEAGASSTSSATDEDRSGTVALTEAPASAAEVTASAQGWIAELNERIEASEAVQGADGHVVLGVEEAARLVQTLQQVVSGCTFLPQLRLRTPPSGRSS